MEDEHELAIIPYSWNGLDYTRTREDEETGRKIYDKRRYTIFIWGHNQFNEATAWIINNYLPSCIVRIETKIEGDQKDAAPYIVQALERDLMEWVKEQSVKPANSYMKSLLHQSQGNIIAGYCLDSRIPMFYYNTEPSFLYRIFFNLETGMSCCYKFLSSKKIRVRIRTIEGEKIIPLEAKAYHNGDSDRISTEQKFIVEKKLNRCDWMTGRGNVPDEEEKYTTLQNEYLIDGASVQPMEKVKSEKLGFPSPCTISIDAEVWSEVYSRFPKASRLNDCMYSMGFRYRKAHNLNDPKRDGRTYLFVIWKATTLGELDLPSEQEYGEIVIVYCFDEEDFYLRLFNHIDILDPSWIISFNGLGFDWEYVETRCSVLGIKVPNLSRIRDWYKSNFVQRRWKRWLSTYPNYPGRIDVDMLNIIRGQFKMNSYSLKNVTKELLPGHKGKVDLPYKEQFKIFGEGDRTGMGKIMDYLAMDVKLPESLYDRLSIPIYLHTNGGVMHVNPIDLYTTGQSIRCVNQLYERVMARGYFVNSRKVEKAGKYIGGLVWTNKVGPHKNVLIVDFNSLYPSKMKEKNICFSTILDEAAEKLKPENERWKDEDLMVVEGDVPIVDKKTKEITHHEYHKFRFVPKTVRLGLLPEIVTTLNNLRSDYKKEMANCKKMAKECETAGDMAGKKKWMDEAAIWDVKQAAVKVSANSMYGFMGMKSGKYSFVEGAMATTLAGQDALRTLINIIETKYDGFIVYGDTDSAMVIFPDRYVTQDNYFVNGGKLAKEISAEFSEDLNLACENFMLVFVSFTPKRYAAIKINPKNPSGFPTKEEILEEGLFYLKGLCSVRGNTMGVTKIAFNDILLESMIKENNKQARAQNAREILDLISDYVLRIVRREFPLKEYTVVQRLGANYKSESHEMAKFSERLKQMGRSVQAGDELEYVIMRTRGDTYKGNKMQAPDIFAEEENVLDTFFYIEHSFNNPVSEILDVLYTDECLNASEKKKCRPRKATKSQKVTPAWHLEKYIEKVILAEHVKFERCMRHLRYMREEAKKVGAYVETVYNDTMVKTKMMDKYEMDWSPPKRTMEEDLQIDALEIQPIHRHAIWNEPTVALLRPDNQYGVPEDN